MVLRCWRCGVKAKCFLFFFFLTRETASKTETSEIFVCVCLTNKISHQINSTKQSLVLKDYARLSGFLNPPNPKPPRFLSFSNA